MLDQALDRGDTGGSSLHTSTAAPATWPESSAARRSASSTMPPRAQLTTRAPALHARRARAPPIMFSVSSVSGTCTVRMSARLSTVCRSVRRTPRSRARLSGNERIVDQDLHVEGPQPGRHPRAHLAEPEHARRLAIELGAVDAPVPLEPLERVVGRRDLADEGQQHAHGVLGRGDHVAVGRVDHHHALARAGVHVDVVHADPGPPQDAQPPRMAEELRGHRGGGARDDRLVVAEPRVQLLRGQLARDLVHLEPALGEIRDTLGRDGVDDHDLHGHATRSGCSPDGRARDGCPPPGECGGHVWPPADYERRRFTGGCGGSGGSRGPRRGGAS